MKYRIAGGNELVFFIAQGHLRGANFAANADDFGAGDEVFAAPRPQVINTHIDGAEARHALHFFFTGHALESAISSRHCRSTTDAIEQRSNDAAVQDFLEGVAH